MIDLFKSLFNSPEAEKDPSAWAARYVAHLGLGVIATVILIAFLPLRWALSVAVLGYVAWGTLQYRNVPSETRTKALRWDGVLDLTAWTSGVLIVATLATGDIGGVVLVVIAAVIAIAAGVSKRS